jgi:hypothetical protein
MDTPPVTAKVVSARIPEPLLVQVKALAQQQDRSVSSTVRRALSEHVARSLETPLTRGER